MESMKQESMAQETVKQETGKKYGIFRGTKD